MASRSRPWLLLLFALITGGAAAWLALGYLRDQSTPLSRGPVAGKAVVATKDLPVGALVTERDIRMIDWPGEAVPPGLLGSMEEVIGRGVVSTIRTNEPFLESKLAPKGAGGGLTNLIAEGMRALAIRVDDVVGVSGFVIPGTRVDVLLTMAKSPGSNETMTRILMQNVPTIAAGQTIQRDAEGKPISVPVITVLVTPEQAETLVLAGKEGRIQMALRNTLDTLTIVTTGSVASTLMNGPTATRVSGGRRVVVRQSRNQTTVVEGFRGGEKTLSRFSESSAPSPDRGSP
jgi:pilus assembly protein CpaB